MECAGDLPPPLGPCFEVVAPTAPGRDRTGGSRTAPTGVERENRDGEPDSAVGAVREPPVTEDHEAEQGTGSGAPALNFPPGFLNCATGRRKSTISFLCERYRYRSITV